MAPTCVVGGARARAAADGRRQLQARALSQASVQERWSGLWRSEAAAIRTTRQWQLASRNAPIAPTATTAVRAAQFLHHEVGTGKQQLQPQALLAPAPVQYASLGRPCCGQVRELRAGGAPAASGRRASARGAAALAVSAHPPPHQQLAGEAGLPRAGLPVRRAVRVAEQCAQQRGRSASCVFAATAQSVAPGGRARRGCLQLAIDGKPLHARRHME